MCMGRDAGLPGAARQAAFAISGMFSEDSRFCSEGKREKESCREARYLAEPTQVHGLVRVTLISMSLRGMGNIQPSTNFSLFADLFYLLRVSHSSGVYRRVNLIYDEVPHYGMKCHTMV